MTAQPSQFTAPSRRWLMPWLAGYQRAWLSRDLIAGLALGVVMIPQGMAYAELAGVPAVTGLYATPEQMMGGAALMAFADTTVTSDLAQYPDLAPQRGSAPAGSAQPIG